MSAVDIRSFLELNSTCTPMCRSIVHKKQCSASFTLDAINEDYIKSYLISTCQNFYRSHEKTINLLHWASSCGKASTLEWLLENFFDFFEHVLNAKDAESGYAPLHRALLFGNISCAQILLKFGASTGIVDNEGLTQIDLVRLNTVDLPSNNDTTRIYGAGENVSFNLGHCVPTRKSQYDLIDIPLENSDRIVQVAMSNFHTLFLAKSGSIFTCGHGAGGRLGHGDENAQITPVLVETSKLIFVSIAVSNSHCLAVTNDGDAYSWGDNSYRALGHSSNPNEKETKPRLIAFPKNYKLACQFVGCCAAVNASVLWSENLVHTFGENAGHLGHAKEDGAHIVAPRKVSLGNVKNIDHIAACKSAVALVTKKGDVYLFKDYDVKKVVNRMLDLKMVQVLPLPGAENRIRLILLATSGKVYQWCDGDSSVVRTAFFGIPKMIYPIHLSCHSGGLLLIVSNGDLFNGEFAETGCKSKNEITKGSTSTEPGPSSSSSNCVQNTKNRQMKKERENQYENNHHRASGFFHCKKPDFLDYSECYRVNVSKVSGVFRAQWSAVSPNGQNSMICVQKCVGHLPCESNMTHQSTFASDFGKLLDEASVFNDLEVVCKSRTFLAHKFVLASRSSYFAKLLCDNNIKNRLSIPSDIDSKVVDIALKIIYLSDHDAKADKNENKVKTGKSGKKSDHNAAVTQALKIFGVSNLSKKCTFNFDLTKWKQFCDMSLRCNDDVEISCHKCVLFARVDYFRCMFASSWVETTNSQTSYLINADSKTASRLLRYVYTDQLELSEFSSTNQNEPLSQLCKLIALADEWLLDRLKELCEHKLCSSINVKNVCELLLFSEDYNASRLNKSCKNFICLNLFSLLPTQQFLALPRQTVLEIESLYKRNIFNVVLAPIRPFTNSGVTPEDLEMSYVMLKSCGVDDLNECARALVERQHFFEQNKSKRQNRKSLTLATKARRISTSEKSITPDISRSLDEKQDFPSSPDTASVLDSSLQNLAIEAVGPPTLSIAEKQKSNKKISPWSFEPTSPIKGYELISLKDVMEKEEKAQEAISSAKKLFVSGMTKTAKLSSGKKKSWDIPSPALLDNSATFPSPPFAPSKAIDWPSPNNASKQPERKNISVALTLDQKSKITSSAYQQAPPALCDIILEEERSLVHRQEILNKPLKYIQVEEQALQELLLAYDAENNFDVLITSERCVSGRVAEPFWQAHCGSPRAL